MSRFPALGIEVTSAVFQAKGKVSNSKVALIIDVNDGKIAGKQSDVPSASADNTDLGFDNS